MSAFSITVTLAATYTSASAISYCNAPVDNSRVKAGAVGVLAGIPVFTYVSTLL